MAKIAPASKLRSSSLRLLLPLELLLVELQLLALEHVPVGTAALARPARDAGQEAAGHELLLDQRVDLVRAAARHLLRLHVAAALLRALLAGLALRLLRDEVDAVLLEVVLAEERRVDLHDRVLHERLRAHQLVVRRVVHGVADPALARAVLRAPGEVAGVQAQRPDLRVAAAGADEADALLPDLRHRRRPGELELPLLLVDRPLTAGRAVLVTAVTSDAHACGTLE